MNVFLRTSKMAEISFGSPSSEIDKFHERNNAYSLEKLEDCLDFCSMTSVPKNSASCLNGGDGIEAGIESDEPDNDRDPTLARLDGVVRHCFSNLKDSSVDGCCTDPVQIKQQEEHLRENELWFTITKNFGNVLPVDWFATYARQLQEKSLEIKQAKTSQSSELDISDDEELQQSFDLHSLIISSLHQEPMFTADEVISEIEGMLEDSPPASATELDVFSPELLKFRERSRELGKSLESKASTDLDGWSVRSLSELYDELDSTVREYSEVLIQQLALREELDYEKELMNQFISLHVNIQKKKRELQADQKRGTTPSDGAITISSLTTQIPYYPTVEPISAELLEVYVKILKAMDSESSSLPTILTDYILKVVCPTS